MPTLGLDLSINKVAAYRQHIDPTGEVSTKDLKAATKLQCHTDPAVLEEADFIIITVPTPVDVAQQPDLTPQIKCSEAVAAHLKRGTTIVYESTVFPGATEDICIPILEEQSGLVFNKDFFCGYSPERINPGDKKHRLTNIKKITAGSTPEIANEIDELYQKIIIAGTHMAESIKVAEAAKVIENIQRDINIALINELAIIFNKLDIDTKAVLEAAGTKWNFLPFRPGLVGGHCIGVDPYYLVHKAKEARYNPKFILEGRRLNDGMASYVADQVSNIMTKKRINVIDANILIMGLTFKENCPDLRNTQVVELVKEFERFNCKVDVYDPCVDKNETFNEYRIQLIDRPAEGKYDAIILAVAHDEFKVLSLDEIKSFGKDNFVLYDIKYLFSDYEVDGRL